MGRKPQKRHLAWSEPGFVVIIIRAALGGPFPLNATISHASPFFLQLPDYRTLLLKLDPHPILSISYPTNSSAVLYKRSY